MDYCNQENVVLYTTREVIFETATLLRYKAGYSHAKKFLEVIVPSIKTFYLSKEFIQHVKKHFLKLAKDKELSLCDVLSYLVVSDILGADTPCFSFDEDFKSLGLLVIE